MSDSEESNVSDTHETQNENDFMNLEIHASFENKSNQSSDKDDKSDGLDTSSCESDSEESSYDFDFGFDFDEKESMDNLVKCLESSSLIQKDNKIKIGGPLKDDFSPWWNELTSDIEADGLKKKKVPSAIESWLDPDPSDSSWLLGDSSKPTQSSKTSTVEDIPVPSIYETKLTSKGKRQLKRERRAEREKTLGKGWFNMRAPSPDSDAHKDMELIRMRGVLDPKRFFKNHDRKAAPKYFQMGTVMDEGTEFYGARLTKKQRKHTLVEELMADAQTRQYNKKKYAELQQKMRSKSKQKGKKAK